MTIRIINDVEKYIGDYKYTAAERGGLELWYNSYPTWAGKTEKTIDFNDVVGLQEDYNLLGGSSFVIKLVFYTDKSYTSTASFILGEEGGLESSGFYYSYNGETAITIRRTRSNAAYGVEIYILELIQAGQVVVERVIDNTKQTYSDIQESVTFDGGITLPVMVMDRTFENCSNLVTAPSIPRYVRQFNRPFDNCPNLKGNILVYCTDVIRFDTNGSINDLYFIDKTDGYDSKIKSICNNVASFHYEAYDNKPPELNFSLTRVQNSGQTIESLEGVWCYVKATITIYNTYVPDGWKCSLDSINLNVDGSEKTVTWQKTSTTENKITTILAETWVNCGDSSSHEFELRVSDRVIDDDQITRRQSTSQKIKVVLPSAFATIDFLKGGAGVAFGKFATQPGFWCEFDANFKDVETESITCDDISSNGIITGNDVLNLKNNNYIRGGGGVLNEGLGFVDSYGDRIAYMKAYHERDSQDRLREGFNIGTSREVNGATIWNALRMLIDDDGNPTVFISQPDSWLKALGLYEPTTPTISLTNITTGSIDTIRGKLYGKQMHLVLAFKNSSAVASGSNIFVGTISQTDYRPKDFATGVGYYGGAAVIVQIQAEGKVTARVIGATVPANAVVWTNVSFLIP